MKALVSSLLVKRGLRLAMAALSFGLLAVPQARAQDSREEQKVNLDTLLSARRVSSPSRSANIEPIPLATGTELISDGGFEVGSSPSGTYTFTTLSSAWSWQYTGLMSTAVPRYWSISSGQVAAHTGNWCVYFDLGPSTNRLYQTVTIPSGATATLSFWLKIGTFETTHTGAYDTLKVSIADTSGVPLASFTYSNLDAASSWVNHAFDVSAYAGRTVRVQFDSYEDSTGDTIFKLDDISLLASVSTASCVEDAFTMCLVNGRYKVTSHWKNQYATTPVVANLSKAKLTDKTGAFWIADADTYEYLIRFNTATNNGKSWVNVTTFTSVEFWVEVTDTVNGQTKEYHNAPGDTTMIWDPYTFIYP